MAFSNRQKTDSRFYSRQSPVGGGKPAPTFVLWHVQNSLPRRDPLGGLRAKAVVQPPVYRMTHRHRRQGAFDVRRSLLLMRILIIKLPPLINQAPLA